MTADKCPKCNSTEYFYIQRAYEYHSAYVSKDGVIELINMDDSFVDDEYRAHFKCMNCEYERTPNDNGLYETGQCSSCGRDGRVDIEPATCQTCGHRFSACDDCSRKTCTTCEYAPSKAR
jgi:hypothetical protein